ncbi:GTPase [Noviherbaspirillum pedocola]|uniref:GTPase n=1 Tax=Noviherbaspirillum pedocola TaxID=2801341 RepID=A0A934STH3_9BURK|nr:GTPase [Noviherbaspirillum pedocola]MBK4736486.1 GTPase [Noviherbaspirillum pedocola]
MTLTTLVAGGTAAAREAAIAAALDRQTSTALILEGLASGQPVFDAHSNDAMLIVARIAPGCLCCTGNLTMRVTLNRILRHPPQRLFISLAQDAHLDQIHAFLRTAPYDGLLMLTDDLRLPS